MHLRIGDEGIARSDGLSAHRFSSSLSQLRSERVREIRQRIADDVYRSDDVVEEIARRILRSRDL